MINKKLQWCLKNIEGFSLDSKISIHTDYYSNVTSPIFWVTTRANFCRKRNNSYLCYHKTFKDIDFEDFDEDGAIEEVLDETIKRFKVRQEAENYG